MYLVFFEVKWEKSSPLAGLKVPTCLSVSSQPYVQKGFSTIGAKTRQVQNRS